MLTNDPSAVRKEMRQRRALLTDPYRQQAASQACQNVMGKPWFVRTKRIGGYIPANGELDPLPVLELAMALGKQCYLPVLRPFRQPKLWFARWRTGEQLVANRFGIPEPAQLNNKLIAPWAIDLLFMPLVAFDKRGCRLGMGGGYYDRTFSYTRIRQQWKKPLRVGFAYEFQQLDEIASNSWDIPLDMIVTEKTVHTPMHRCATPEDA